MALKRFAAIAMLRAALSARFHRKSSSKQKMQIAGVPVENYREDANDFMLLFKEDASTAKVKGICAGRCAFEGNPDAGGLAFGVVHGRKQLEELLNEHGGDVRLLEPDETDRAIPDLDDGKDEGKDEEVKMGKARSAPWGLREVGVSERPATGRGVHVYVQDTGIRVSHRDFGGRASTAIDLTGGTVVECEEDDLDCARDRRGHGTHCAGTAAGNTYGVASDALIHAVKTLGNQGTGNRSWNIVAIDWITTKGKKPAVISMSLGGTGQDQAYVAVIDQATAAGITVVAAAGNFAIDACGISPAFVPNAITVGATDSSSRRASYSNWGECNDIMAPGTSVKSAIHTNDWYGTSKTGTSQACPHVSGAAAILLEAHPTWKRNDIMAHLTEFGRKGYVKNLESGDPDLFLWVGRDPAPGAPICPDYATYKEPSYWGDCKCKQGFCSTDGVNKNCPTSAGPGGWGGTYFSYTCSSCKCY